MDQSGLIVFFFKDKNPFYIRFVPLYLFDTENDVKNNINYVSCDYENGGSDFEVVNSLPTPLAMMLYKITCLDTNFFVLFQMKHFYTLQIFLKSPYHRLIDGKCFIYLFIKYMEKFDKVK